MKKSILIALISLLPALAMASGEQQTPMMPGTMSGDAQMPGHSMPGMDHMNNMHGDMSMHEGMTGDGQAMHGGMAGQPGDPAKVDRTIDIHMSDDMRFAPADLRVKAGETIRFFARNEGRMVHEMVIGTADRLAQHAEMMRKMPEMSHAAPNMIRLNAGQRGGLVWRFDKPGSFEYACLLPGHREAGMKGRIVVE
ncbi:hypothetical protein BI364_07800 [Acidihalobacter yilgarnensis]|uniref:Blue (type 1) copper domain-containing protein n=1 Tax=Acidihalobacter yilgarnensis TaxID=2819280 RepID=A0A1D8IN27_9GAMM|nr:cupredoxin family protein [Acidihalobacter yilgarnensis]AOU97879.1 hypothetical protein BI364_07800 [Acidihalobacter yilgarnensis]